ncbi:hypothetical protein FALB51S_02344 [Frigidibacter albus]
MNEQAGRRARGGGGAARRAERSAVHFETARFIERNIPNLEMLNEEALEIIERNAETVLAEIGVNFVENPGALELWRAAGADVQGERVRIPRGLARQLCATAPSRIVQHARNPERTVEIGGRSLVLAPVYGPPFVRDAAGGRRYATMADFNNFVKLGYMSKWLHHSGGTVCEPTDVPVNKRHLDMLFAHMTLSDKPYMGSVTEPSRAADSVEMSKILFGADFVDANTVMTSLININSPMTFDGIMMGALEVYARANQACIISPFIVGGAMAPVSVAGTLTQVLAEVLAGVAYSQLVRKGAPVIFGAFVTSIDMNSGAPTFGTPEASHITYGAGQLARRLGLPYRSAGAFCGSKLPDAQAAYKSANSLNMGLLSGVNFMLHACGWLEGGLVSSYEKFVMDADRAGHPAPPRGRGAGGRGGAGDGRDPRSGAERALPWLRPYPGEFQGCLLAHRPAGLQALRDLGGGGRARYRGAGLGAGGKAAGRLSETGHRPRGGRGAGRLCDAEEGRDGRRLPVRLCRNGNDDGGRRKRRLSLFVL